MPMCSFAPSSSMACLQCSARLLEWQAKLLLAEELQQGGVEEFCTQIGYEIRNSHDFGTH